MAIRVEFYGIARQRAGVGETELTLEGPQTSLGCVLDEVARRYPAVAAECLCEGGLRSGYIANIGGDRFVSHPETILADGACLLLLSADGGG